MADWVSALILGTSLVAASVFIQHGMERFGSHTMDNRRLHASLEVSKKAADKKEGSGSAGGGTSGLG